MFSEDNLAAAQIAQIFGSELLKVQQNAQTDSGSMPEIVKLDPKQFLVGQNQFHSNRKADEQRMIQSLQREAEAAYPVDPPQHYSPQVEPVTLPPQLTSVAPTAPPQSFVVKKFTQDSSLDVLERIALSLERIANSVDKVEIKAKKKIVKQKTNKLKLINEINS